MPVTGSTARATRHTEGAQSIARAALLLRTLSTFGAMGASLMEISQLTELPKATAHRILAALLEERLVERPPGTRNYRLGPDIQAFGAPLRAWGSLREMARPALERLAGESGATAYLGVRSGYDMLCVDKADLTADRPDLLLEVNDRWPLGIGSFSLALLAFLPEREVADVVAFNRRRVSEKDTSTFEHIDKSILKTRRNGHATRTTRSFRGLAGIAVPVFDERRYPLASLCIVDDARRMTSPAQARLARALKREAALITHLYESGRLQEQQQERWRLAVRGSVDGRARD